MRCEVLEDDFIDYVLTCMAVCNEQEYVYFNIYCVIEMNKVYKKWLMGEKMIS